MCIITLHTFHATIVSKGGTGWPLAFVRQYCDLQVRKEWLLVIAWRRRCHDNSCPPPWFVVPPNTVVCLRLIFIAVESILPRAVWTTTYFRSTWKFRFFNVFSTGKLHFTEGTCYLVIRASNFRFFYDLSQSLLSKLNYFFFVAKVIDVFV